MPATPTVLIGLAALALVLLGGRAIFSRFSQRPRRLHGEREDGRLVLRAPRLLGIAIALTALPPVALVAALAYVLARRSALSVRGEVLAAAVVVVGLGAVGWLLAAGFRLRVVADDLGVERFGVATRRRLAWADVVRVAYNPMSRSIFLAGAGGVRLWVSEDLAGIGDFAELALARLPKGVLLAHPEAREVLEELVEEARAQ